MKRANRLYGACALTLLTVSQPRAANLPLEDAAGFSVLNGSAGKFEKEALIPKAGFAQTLAARGLVTPSATLYGGFQLTSSAVVYILVRGNSLGTLGITQAYLDAPRVRIYNAQGQDLLFAQNGTAGFNFCLSTNTSNSPVYDYYVTFRHEPPSSNDACYAGTFSAGTYTFSVTPSIAGVTATFTSVPPLGEVLFEVTLNP